MPPRVAVLIQFSSVLQKILFHKCGEPHKSKVLLLPHYREESWVRLKNHITRKGKKPGMRSQKEMDTSRETSMPLISHSCPGFIWCRPHSGPQAQGNPVCVAIATASQNLEIPAAYNINHQEKRGQSKLQNMYFMEAIERRTEVETVCTSSQNIGPDPPARELIRYAGSWAPRKTHWIRSTRGGAQYCVLISLLSDFESC